MQKFFLLFCFLAALSHAAFSHGDPPVRFRHNYSETLVMKLFLCGVNEQGEPDVFCTFSQALDIIRTVDSLTLGVPKIIYLVGWQYNGHDDKYPAFFEVNRALKRTEDADARTSLLWLMREARGYHTTVSLHINMTDAYRNSPLWQTYVDRDMISKNEDGSLMVTGSYNHREAYQVNYRNEWERGWAQKRIDSLLRVLPALRKAGTIHLDSWIARENRGERESAVLEAEYQKKVCVYWRSKGIDVTSEWSMDYMVGMVPLGWHFNNWTQQDYLDVPAAVYVGGGLNPDVRNSDFGLGFLFGTSLYGENIFRTIRDHPESREWVSSFTRDFYLKSVPYFFLNACQRLGVTGEGDRRVASFSGGIAVSLADSTVTIGRRLLRKGNNLCFPAGWLKNSYIAYSGQGCTGWRFVLPVSWKGVRTVRARTVAVAGMPGYGSAQTIPVKNGAIFLDLSAGQPLVLTPEK